MMFGYKIKAMSKGMREMMFGYKIKAMRKGCVSYAQENAQDDVWVLNTYHIAKNYLNKWDKCQDPNKN